MSKNLLSQNAFGKLVGITQQAVNKLISQGKLSHVGTKLKMPDAQQEYLALKNEYTTAPGLTDKAQTGNQYQRAKTAKETFGAKLLELELKVKQNKLIAIEDVIKEVQAVCEVVRTSFLNIPNKVSAQLEDKSAAEIQILLREAINESLTELFALSNKYKGENGEPENL